QDLRGVLAERRRRPRVPTPVPTREPARERRMLVRADDRADRFQRANCPPPRPAFCPARLPARRPSVTTEDQLHRVDKEIQNPVTYALSDRHCDEWGIRPSRLPAIRLSRLPARRPSGPLALARGSACATPPRSPGGASTCRRGPSAALPGIGRTQCRRHVRRSRGPP